MEMANYEEVPAQIAQKLVAEHKSGDEEEKE